MFLDPKNAQGRSHIDIITTKLRLLRLFNAKRAVLVEASEIV